MSGAFRKLDGYELVGQPDFDSPGQPQLVKDHPELISVMFCGERLIVDRPYFDKVRDMARGYVKVGEY